MPDKYIKKVMLPRAELFSSKKIKNTLLSVTLELTARCNNNCRHCYVNLPEHDPAEKDELSFDRICGIIDEAAELGTLWFTLTGGEPLLREDFKDIYMHIKKRGMLPSVLTNATLIDKDHVDMFKKYPPRNLEISVYGITERTYERVTRRPGNFSRFMDGFNLLRDNNIKMVLRSPVIRSLYDEYRSVIEFCTKFSCAKLNFDPLIFMRNDYNKERNETIKKERLEPERISLLRAVFYNVVNKSLPDARQPVDGIDRGDCSDGRTPGNGTCGNDTFSCNAGTQSCKIGYDGSIYICSMSKVGAKRLNLKNKSLTELWKHDIPVQAEKCFQNIKYPDQCLKCSDKKKCFWCPGISSLESQEGQSCYYSEYICALGKIS